MLSNLFYAMSLLGAEWVLYLLVALSILSIGVIIERFRFYRDAARGLTDFRNQVRKAANANAWEDVFKLAEARRAILDTKSPDMETSMTRELMSQVAQNDKKKNPEVLTELASDAVIQARVKWEKNLAILATIGTNAPFVGLFGTVLGIIKAFHDLSQQAGGAATAVTAGISEALVATAVGIMVAIPAAVAFNLYQRKVKEAVSEAESLKSFLIGKIAE